MKDCGSCLYWVKLKTRHRGICERNDYLTNSDYGKNCLDYKRKKTTRNSRRKRIVIDEEEKFIVPDGG